MVNCQYCLLDLNKLHIKMVFIWSSITILYVNINYGSTTSCLSFWFCGRLNSLNKKKKKIMLINSFAVFMLNKYVKGNMSETMRIWYVSHQKTQDKYTEKLTASGWQKIQVMCQNICDIKMHTRKMNLSKFITNLPHTRTQTYKEH